MKIFMLFFFSFSLFARTVIPKGEILVLDKDQEYDELIVHGELRCSPHKSFIVRVKSIQVFGKFQCGTDLSPIKKNIRFYLEDSLMVHSGGVLDLHGDGSKAGWTHLNKTLRKDSRELHLDLKDRKLFSHWQKDDEIIIGPTGPDSLEAELHQIESVNVKKGIITLKEDVKFQHWGELIPYGKILLDERAEVANLTRSIVIQNDKPVNEIGGHTMVMKGSRAFVEGVELKGLGQAGKLASYPFHWHQAGDVKGQYFRNSSIHQSFQRCVVIHETMNALVHNNTCFDFKGHGFFLETGNETGNILSHNLAMLAKYPSPEKSLLASDRNLSEEGIRDHRFAGVSSFWISHPDNIIKDNVAAGSVGTGFWMAFANKIQAFDSATKKFSGPLLASPAISNTWEYSGNIAHSSLVGHTWDGVPRFGDEIEAVIHNPLNPQDRKLRLNRYRPEKVPRFQHLSAWKNRHTGIYYRGDTAIFEKTILADNGWSWFVANNQILLDSIIVGESPNHSPSEDQHWPLERKAGVVLYDGPTEIQGVSFFDFPTEKVLRKNVDVTAVPFLTIGGNRKYSEIVKGLRFRPEPLYRLMNEPKYIKHQWWMDAVYSEHIIDVDGSLSGSKHAQILPMLVAPDCKLNTKLEGMSVCPAGKTSVLIVFHGGDDIRIPFVLKKDQKIINMTAERLKEAFDVKNNFYQNKARLLNGPQDEYEFQFIGGLKEISFQLNSHAHGAISPVMTFSGLGKNCVVKEMTEATSVEIFRKTYPPVYFPVPDGVMIKAKMDKLLPFIKPAYGKGLSGENQSPLFHINC